MKRYHWPLTIFLAAKFSEPSEDRFVGFWSLNDFLSVGIGKYGVSRFLYAVPL